MSLIQILAAVAGGLFCLLAPGLAWSYALVTGDKTNWLERLALSFALSISLVSLTTYSLNKLAGLPINLTSSLITVGCIIATAMLLIIFRHRETLPREVGRRLATLRHKSIGHSKMSD